MEKYKKILEYLEFNKNKSCEKYEFGMHEIDKREIFITTKYSYGFVNNKPLLPGHILLTTLKKKKKYNDLDIEEIIDINLLSNFMCYVMGKLFNTTSFSIAIQDGKEAGQTVEQVHIHIIPRKSSDYKNNDNIYKDLNKINLGYGKNIICDSCQHSINVFSQIPIEENFKLEEFNISIRSMEEMEKEANLIKSFIHNFSSQI
ncbi:histidine triad protein, putative [Plasmodium relictum]|uniref:Bis(5'-adenosyl)-triphosphatase n=1 Tax=Plasmodium relictum TaxID=85471 RepID=A0A1J1HDD1_PLARL|nr:histidine triad protein, putative [Plasmodium relictum]CRH03782.1 histidine triad protein, putative [Plasmodium relictum]